MPKRRVAAKKKARRPPKVPVGPDPAYYHIYRVNRARTIYWQLPENYVSAQEAEMDAQLLTSRAVVMGKRHLYIALDGPTSLYLWLGYDVRVSTERARSNSAKLRSNASAQIYCHWQETEELPE